ncbi:hypothetical protein [uncultured Vagococcus sp.]|uniref:hypothetical protein n=1 Tax=uncultured Vagococcus sp. TaxID=189676 RepID=UPI0028D0F02C|nr:hypothetical protein [uncultured Vagococcus sp.]
MNNRGKLGLIIIFCLLLGGALSMPAHASNTAADVGTNVGVGFGEADKQEPTPSGEPIKPKQPAEVVVPKLTSNSLPQLGKFIEPMTMVLLGLLIWLVILSIMALKKYLHPKGEI